MKLELKYLSPYLPYQVEFVHKGGMAKLTTKTINEIENNLYEDVKLVLLPISWLSRLVEEEFEKYTGQRYGTANKEIIDLFCEENGIDDLIENLELSSLPYECIEFMFTNGYDYFGLIEKGKAINKLKI